MKETPFYLYPSLDDKSNESNNRNVENSTNSLNSTADSLIVPRIFPETLNEYPKMMVIGEDRYCTFFHLIQETKCEWVINVSNNIRMIGGINRIKCNETDKYVIELLSDLTLLKSVLKEREEKNIQDKTLVIIDNLTPNIINEHKDYFNNLLLNSRSMKLSLIVALDYPYANYPVIINQMANCDCVLLTGTDNFYNMSYMYRIYKDNYYGDELSLDDNEQDDGNIISFGFFWKLPRRYIKYREMDLLS